MAAKDHLWARRRTEIHSSAVESSQVASSLAGGDQRESECRQLWKAAYLGYINERNLSRSTEDTPESLMGSSFVQSTRYCAAKAEEWASTG